MYRIIFFYLLVFPFLTPAIAAPNTFFNHLAGNWSGGGRAYLPRAGEVSVNCQLKIMGSETNISMKGTCGLFLFRQGLGFNLRNVGGVKYVGTYTGSRTGPAGLEGMLNGNELDLTINWGGLVNGDRTAKMILKRTGPNTFTQTVIDSVAGKSRTTSNFIFARS